MKTTNYKWMYPAHFPGYAIEEKNQDSFLIQFNQNNLTIKAQL